MRIWLVRAGSHGEQAEYAVDHEVAVIGWGELGDLSEAYSAEDVAGLLGRHGRSMPAQQRSREASQISAFSHSIAKGDIVITPAADGDVLVGRVAGEYEYHGDEEHAVRHHIPVDWAGRASREDLAEELNEYLGRRSRGMTVRELDPQVALSAVELLYDDPARAWIFQANPKRFDLEEALQDPDNDVMSWHVSRFRNDISPGDRVYLWLSGPEAGIRAAGTILTEPDVQDADSGESSPYWVDEEESPDSVITSWLEVNEILEQPLLKNLLVQNPVLRDLTIIRSPTGTNFAVTPEQEEALEALLGNDAEGAVPDARLFLITAGNREAQEHLELSLRRGVDLDALDDLHDIRDELEQHAHNDRVFAWGARPGATAESNWEQLKPGDIALVYASGKFVLWGRVYAKARSEDAAQRTWGSDANDATWSCMFFLDPVRGVDASRSYVVQQLGFKDNFVPQGFSIPRQEAQARLRHRFGSAEEFARSLELGSAQPRSEEPSRVLSLADAIEAAKAAGLLLNPGVVGAAVAALNAGKHVIFTGPPGTAKTTFAQLLADLAGRSGLSDGFVLTTATSDWTTYETIGGLRPTGENELTFEEGHFLSAIRANRWLVVDELNRSNFDRAFGQLFTVLSGQPVVLPYRRRDEPDPLAVVPADATPPMQDLDILEVPSSWRIIATMNVFDKSLLFEMSYALMRRFAFVEVPSPALADFEELISRAAGDDDQAIAVASNLLALRQVKDLGPAVYMDIARFAHARGADATAAQMAYEAFYGFLMPQFEGVEDEEADLVFNLVAPLVAATDRQRLKATMTAVLGVQLSGVQVDSSEPDAE